MMFTEAQKSKEAESNQADQGHPEGSRSSAEVMGEEQKGTTQRTEQGVTPGATQGTTQGTTQGVIQGVTLKSVLTNTNTEMVMKSPYSGDVQPALSPFGSEEHESKVKLDAAAREPEHGSWQQNVSAREEGCPVTPEGPVVAPEQYKQTQHMVVPRQVVEKQDVKRADAGGHHHHHHHHHHRHHRHRQNHVSNVLLHGVPIVSLHIDGKERLCLAQISTTLLKDFSYNEIHNRRVALGVTCVQCTPVQLEILRRAGAMPVSSRRCGMITKREAERLVKSFLDETAPPKLPENFHFDVTHACGWGCRGQFTPSRYNSSRAKCIKCSYCNMFFSPNKFIFHFHRTSDAVYNHPDAANFNSWRRHLKLTESEPAEDLLHAWEDVKAMFNGGTRKRVMSMAISSSTSSKPTSSTSDITAGSAKKMRMLSEQQHQPSMRPPTSQPFNYPVFPVPNKAMGVKSMQPLPTHPAFTMPFQFEGKNMQSEMAPGPSMTSECGKVWGSVPDTYYPPYEMIWAKHLGLTTPESSYVPQPYGKTGREDDSNESSAEDREPEEDYGKMGPRSRLSAFTPVSQRSLSVVTSVSSNSSHSEHGDVASQCSISPSHAALVFHAGENEEDSDSEDVDVDTIDDETPMLRCSEENNNNVVMMKMEPTRHTIDNIMEGKQANDQQGSPRGQEASPNPTKEEDLPNSPAEETSLDLSTSPPRTSHSAPTTRAPTTRPESPQEERSQTNELKATDSQTNENKPVMTGDHIVNLSKEELQQEFVQILATKRRLEEDCKSIRDTFQEQVKRELAYREEMSKQLQVVRETLCHELDEERKVRYSLQQRLKEAHDALQQFSCKLLPPSRCTECAYKEVLLPR